MRWFLLTLLVGLPVLAQVMLPARRIIAPASTDVDPDSFLPEGIVLRWVASDLSSSPVETWTDRIQGFNLKQTTEASKPTWSTNGVAFTSSDFFTGTNITAGNYGTDGAKSCSWLAVLNINAPANPQMILGNTFSGGDMFLVGFTNAVGDGDGAYEIYNISSNLFDLFITRTNFVASHCYATTNGIKALDQATAWVFGGSGITRVGGQTFFMQGVIRELICWTNLVCTETMLSNVHKYATSVYPIAF